MTDRNTKPKETTIEHKIGALLNSKTLSYGDLTSIFIELHQHSKQADWEKAIASLRMNIPYDVEVDTGPPIPGINRLIPKG